MEDKFTTIRIRKDTLEKLRVIAGITRKKMALILDELVTECYQETVKEENTKLTKE